MAAGGQVGGGGLPSKRLKRDENTEPNRQKDLTAEQKATVERNRQLALARRSERQKLGEPPGSEVNMEEQMEKIRRNREAALQRKRQREAAQQSSQEMQKKEDKDEDMFLVILLVLVILIILVVFIDTLCVTLFGRLLGEVLIHGTTVSSALWQHILTTARI
mmetsp:Transcript_18546/g.21593  ORF Transcript_18546/g.21593 Transcript_18546/m.21593 type:complete len:162 (+) Transcript_18546:51-536(+)